jgi:predicted RNA methylase
MSRNDAEDRARAILATAELIGTQLRLPDQLSRPDYEAVNKVLLALGGKWNRGQRAHVFPTDPRPALKGFLAGHSAPKPPRTAEGYVATPDALADEIVANYSSVDELAAGSTVLEPSAGDGALVRAIRRAAAGSARIVAVEPNLQRAQLIEADEVVTTTLEAYAATGPGPIHAVVMNPPFAVPGQRSIWIDHLRLAWQLLEPGGRLVSIAPAGYEFRHDRRHRAIRELVETHGGSKSLDDDAFASQGSAVRTVVVWADKPTETP